MKCRTTYLMYNCTRSVSREGFKPAKISLRLAPVIRSTTKTEDYKPSNGNDYRTTLSTRHWLQTKTVLSKPLFICQNLTVLRLGYRCNATTLSSEVPFFTVSHCVKFGRQIFRECHRIVLLLKAGSNSHNAQNSIIALAPDL